ncbi:hypothetical protein RFI_13654 [Reticulomyxa filosa]|uniref:Uncharacterized protein n=1 Tax=Reticulomyxa filosa TaxID=46433 RepID=X6NBY3_RETFI|nr:hypothetical protein RFI_13654 [Reticulomyxa filosa]|eukprot:ETO23526.1 hypothetical protein RFI_13654 [Reticulomyxa filosa]
MYIHSRSIANTVWGFNYQQVDKKLIEEHCREMHHEPENKDKLLFTRKRDRIAFGSVAVDYIQDKEQEEISKDETPAQWRDRQCQVFGSIQRIEICKIIGVMNSTVYNTVNDITVDSIGTKNVIKIINNY